jgi:hypothetical protein
MCNFYFILNGLVQARASGKTLLHRLQATQAGTTILVPVKPNLRKVLKVPRHGFTVPLLPWSSCQ